MIADPFPELLRRILFVDDVTKLSVTKPKDVTKPVTKISVADRLGTNPARIHSDPTRPARPGRPTKGVKAMTAAERKRRSRAAKKHSA